MGQSQRLQRGFSVHPDWEKPLDNIRIILVGTTHPGNIGAVARVMKNMALKHLTLVSSTEDGPETDAYAMASGAYDVVESSRRSHDLASALSATIMAVGTSGRLGEKRIAAQTPDATVPEILHNAEMGPVAIVFGRESRGLTNEELKLCSHHMVIPTDYRFASMNVAHAVAVVAYEVFKMCCRPTGPKARTIRPATMENREKMYAHIERVLIRSGFLDRSNPLRMMRDIRRILNSASMDDRDVKIIRGIFRKMGNMGKEGHERGQC